MFGMINTFYWDYTLNSRCMELQQAGLRSYYEKDSSMERVFIFPLLYRQSIFEISTSMETSSEQRLSTTGKNSPNGFMHQKTERSTFGTYRVSRPSTAPLSELSSTLNLVDNLWSRFEDMKQEEANLSTSLQGLTECSGSAKYQKMKFSWQIFRDLNAPIFLHVVKAPFSLHNLYSHTLYTKHSNVIFCSTMNLS